jgi:acyl-CoA synthetase (NDP forming)
MAGDGPTLLNHAGSPVVAGLKDLIQAKGRKALLEHEVKDFLKALGLPVPRGMFVPREAVEHLPSPGTMRFPLVAKVASTTIRSKSDVKGVRVGIRDEGALRVIVSELLTIEGAEGVLIEEQAPEGIEVIVGGILDPQFGPVVMFGLGGVFVELFEDVSFALAPMKRDDALWLVRQSKGYRLLEAYRGRPAIDMDTLTRVIISVSEIIASGLISEIDLNPVALYPEGAMILDAKMFVTESPTS